MNEVKQLAKATGRSLNAIYILKRKLGRLPTEQEVRAQRRGRPKKKMSLSEIRHNALLLWCQLATTTTDILLTGELTGERRELYEKLAEAKRLVSAAEDILREIEENDKHL